MYGQRREVSNVTDHCRTAVFWAEEGPRVIVSGGWKTREKEIFLLMWGNAITCSGVPTDFTEFLVSFKAEELDLDTVSVLMTYALELPLDVLESFVAVLSSDEAIQAGSQVISSDISRVSEM